MDRVFIEGLEVDTVIGAYDWERGIRQCLRLDLSFAWDNRPAAAGDDLTLALDYASVSARIQAFAEQSQYQLVETFAERLAEVLMSEFQIPWLLTFYLTRTSSLAALIATPAHPALAGLAGTGCIAADECVDTVDCLASPRQFTRPVCRARTAFLKSPDKPGSHRAITTATTAPSASAPAR